jgi:uncharacterized protein YjbI with pentapeptide repeats
MHSNDPKKSASAYWEEIKRIVTEAETGKADFTRFVFPAGDWNMDCEAECILDHAVFAAGIDFSESRFAKKCWCGETRFQGPAHFYRTRFYDDVSFGRCWFESSANFTEAIFARQAKFEGATFAEDTRFYKSMFANDADFSGTEFKKNAYFQQATFEKTANFTYSRFLGEVRFRETSFRGANNPDKDLAPGLILTNAYFEKAAAVLFYDTCLANALLHSCDVSGFVFSNVRWRKRKGGRRRMVFEEVVNLPEPEPVERPAFDLLRSGQSSADERNYVLIAELYQQLKKNYDSRSDYWTAGDFHYGEMEMKRLSSPQRNAFARWLHRRCGLVAWYRYASQYGESYTRPLLILIVVLVLFAVGYPFVGLDRVSQTPQNADAAQPHLVNDRQTVTLTYFFPTSSPNLGGGVERQLRLIGHSAMTSLYIAAFQKDLVYQPSYPLGRLLALIEVLLTSTLLALFLLAIRRQFRR